MRTRIVLILKGQSGDIVVDDSDDDDQLLEELLEEDKDFSEESDDSDSGYKEDEMAENNLSEEGEKSTLEEVHPEVFLNWFEEDEKGKLPEPEFITYGCWVKVHKERANSDIEYHIPLKSDTKATWYAIMKKMLGQGRGFRMYFKGDYYVVTDFGRYGK